MEDLPLSELHGVSGRMAQAVIALALFPGRDSRTTFVTLLHELLPARMRGLLLAAALFASLIAATLWVMNSGSPLAARDFVLYLWGTIAAMITLFAVSSATKKNDAAKLERLTIGWKARQSGFAPSSTGACSWGPDGNNNAARLALG